MTAELDYQPTDAEINAEILKRDPDLQAELDLFGVTDSRVMSLKVLMLPGYTAQERRFLESAVDLVFKVYGEKSRKYSPTYAILHPLGLAIPAPSEGIPPIETILGRLFHDLSEDFFGINPKDFISYGSETVIVVDAMTRRHAEPYDENIMRIAETDRDHPHLLIAPGKGRDMRRNSLDPYALPFYIPRSPDTSTKMPGILDKYAANHPLLRMYGNTQVPKVGNAVTIGKHANEHPQLIIARG